MNHQSNATVPSREPTAHVWRAQGVKVPLATPGRLDQLTLDIYGLLGLRTMVLICPEHGEMGYTVLRNHLVAARNAIDAAHLGVVAACALAARATVEPLGALSVPVCQPRVAPGLAEVYQALGVDAVVIEYGGVQYTVLAEAAEAALAALSAPAPAGAEDSCREAGAVCGVACAVRAAAGAARPTRAYPAPGLHLKSYYAGEPSPVVRALAKLYEVSFVRVVSATGAIYWVPVGSAGRASEAAAPSVEEVALQLGLWM